jgi:sugar phosphate isomerase/epimerase
MVSNFILSAFGDEIDADLETQLQLLAGEGVHALELRGAWGKNVLDLDQTELQRAHALLKQYGFRVSAIASPIGKSQLAQPRSYEQERMQRAIAAADVFGTRFIRVFSYYYEGSPSLVRGEVLRRMAQLAYLAERAGYVLVHENEKEIYGDTPERCYDLLSSVNSPALRMAFDPANFVQCGVHPMHEAWPLLAEYVDHVHIKDAHMADGTVCPAGQGDGEIPALLAILRESGYNGFLTLEPHLKIAGPAGGFSGAEGMRIAISALRGLLPN